MLVSYGHTQSFQAKNIDVAVNDMARIITGYLRPTRLDNLHLFSGTVSHDVKKKVAPDIEKSKQMQGIDHTQCMVKLQQPHD